MEESNVILKQPVLEGVCKLLGECCSGSYITTYLAQVSLNDIDGPTATKWRRLYNSFVYEQKEHQNANKILSYISLVCSPVRYVNNEEEYYKLLKQLNLQLAFAGLRLNPDGHFQKIITANTIDDAQQRANNLKDKLEKRNIHPAIITYCRAELLQNNYFHAVFESMKGLFQRIRDISGSSFDGTRLIEEVFSSKNPVVLINNCQSQSEKDEHLGFSNLLKGLCGMFRNTESHELKISWTVSELDALEILSIISYCHRRLDKAQKIRIV